MFSHLLRRTHMFLALFLSPWLLMYALSTLAMNHRKSFPETPPPYTTLRETRFDGFLPGTEDHRSQAAVLLASLDLDGAFTAQVRPTDHALVILRQAAFAPLRITYTPSNHRLLIEQQQFRPNTFLERMHRRRGLAQPFLADTLWSLSVDLVIAAMLFWALSGLWLWWQMRATRTYGILSAAAGLALFAFFLAVL
jgi:hypothetical protein